MDNITNPSAVHIMEGIVPPREQVDRLVEASSRAHGHLCAGQVIGVRMSILGLGLLGYVCPLGYPEIKNIIGFVEIERCLADAVAVATGLRFGRGSLKLKNLGLLASTFYDIPTKRAVRILSNEASWAKAGEYVPGAEKDPAAQAEAYRVMPDEELFEVQWVKVHISSEETPGVRPPKVSCQSCGALVRSRQVVEASSGPLCKVCAGRAYFTALSSKES